MSRSVLSGIKTRGDSRVFLPDKTQTASLLYGFKNESFHKFIDVKILKIDLG